MATRSINYKFNQADSVSISSYDATKTSVGNLIKFYTGVSPEENYIGPVRIGLARPMEQATAIPALIISTIRYSNDIDWVFYGDGAAAAATRRVGLYEFNRNTSEYTWKGSILLNYPATGNKSVRAQEVTRDLYTAGTVSCSGTSTLTGSGTTWQTDRLSVGSRIGFGSTEPTEILTWFEITAINSDTSITLDSSGPTITNESYVIEDLRVTQTITNSTVTNGGLHIVKGLRIELFNAGNTSIPAATTIDNIRAVYWLKDAVTQTNTIGYSCGLDTKASWTSQDVYVINANAVASGRIFKYNVRAELILTSGSTESAYILQTAQTATVGNITVTNNGNVVTANHGPGSGVKSLYWTTTNRVYRTDLAGIVDAAISWQTDAMIEVPPGGASTFALTNVFSSVDYDSSIDRFIILTTGASSVRSYITRYNTLSQPFDHVMFTDNKQLDQSLADSTVYSQPSINLSAFTSRMSDGIMHTCRFSTLATLNQMYSLSIGAHETYSFATNQLIITPKFNPVGANKLVELCINNIERLGNAYSAFSPEPFNIYYRTSGIDDNTGSWTLLGEAHSLGSITPSEIQFAISFRTIGNNMIPGRIISLNLVYEDSSTDSHYLPSVDKSSVVNRQFAYLQTSSFGGNIPELRMRIYNASTNSLVLDDTTTLEASGTFEYSVDGTTWNAWDDTEDTIGNYIRYTAASLPSSIKVRALLTQ